MVMDLLNWQEIYLLNKVLNFSKSFAKIIEKYSTPEFDVKNLKLLFMLILVPFQVIKLPDKRETS